MTHVDHRKPSDRAAGNKLNRSHSAVGAAIVASAAMVAVFAFILTNGASSPSETGNGAASGGQRDAATPTVDPTSNAAPSIAASKADRKPPAPTTSKSAALPNTGPESPVFRAGQWIAVIDTYPADAGMPADQLAKDLAAKLIAAGVPAKALLANGQYPGLSNGSLEPFRNTWVVYIGPASSTAAALNICQSQKTQKVYSNPACPTYEPAASG